MAATILVIDDDPLLRHLLQRSLTDAGYTVAATTSGAEARQALAQLAPDLIIAALQLPLAAGQAFLKNLQAEALGRPLLVISALGCQAVSDAPCLSKPFTLSALRDQVACLLASET